MTKYDEAPEAGEESMRAASDDVGIADDAVDHAVERLEAAERDADRSHDAGDDAGVAEAVARMNSIEDELVGLRQDLASAEEYLGQQQDYWFG